MMNTNQSTPLQSGANTTTTEELIVQYLDGELVRKELETVLFDRLSRSEEARMLLREYLVVRGAIRVSREDKRFQLSDDLDDRTRTRIEQIMEAMAAEELVAPTGALIEAETSRGFLADRGAIASTPMSRQLKRWQFRGSLTALSLLLTVGVVWLFSESTRDRQTATVQPSEPSVNARPLTPTQLAPSASPAVQPATYSASSERKHANPRSHTSRTAIGTIDNSMAQNSAQTHDVKTDAPASNTETSDPAEIMISHRYTKAIDAAKNEVVVSGKDRL
jgi:negative regulator of sigma E activity